jgi:hypothetical protein
MQNAIDVIYKFVVIIGFIAGVPVAWSRVKMWVDGVLEEKLRAIKSEFLRNGGGSLRDLNERQDKKLDAINGSMDAIRERMDSELPALTERVATIEGKVTVLTSRLDRGGIE